MTSFTADVKGWSDKALRNSEAIFKQSVQDVTQDAQLPTAKGGRMRVDTGFLRNSHISGKNGSLSEQGEEAYTATIASLELGDTYSAGWTAEYAAYREFGARGQEPDFFMRGALQKWNQFVRLNASKVNGS